MGAISRSDWTESAIREIIGRGGRVTSPLDYLVGKFRKAERQVIKHGWSYEDLFPSEREISRQAIWSYSENREVYLDPADYDERYDNDPRNS